MKYFLLCLTLLCFSHSFAAENCRLPEAFSFEGGVGVYGPSMDGGRSISPNCDLLGHMRDSSIQDCQQAADLGKYNCYQASNNLTYGRVCWACMRIK